MHSTRLLLLFFLTNLTTLLAAQTGIRGIVTDDQDQPVPFATIYLKETTTGTTTNEIGEYDVQLEPGTYTLVFQGLGFERQEVRFTVGNAYLEKNIQLQKQTYRIKEVRVYSGGEDPAYAIMRKAISLAPYYQRQTAAYTADVYLKGSLVMNKIPKLIKKMMDKEVEEDERLEVGKTYTMESMNKIKFASPDKYDHTILSSQSTFPGNNEDDVIGYITYSFYEPNQDMAISPLAPNAFQHYKFVYEGYFYEGNVTVNKIKVVPKRKSQQTYEGYIYIVDNLWNIHSIDVTNDAFFGEINIKQVYAPVKERSWLPISHRFNVKASIFGVKADFRYAGSVKYSDIQLNTGLPVPATLMKQYAAEEAAEKAAEEQALLQQQNEEKTKAQRKMEALLEKEELSNRDMIKLSRLIEKESSKQEEGGDESLEIKNTYNITHKKDTVKKDSLYWETIRPIPLTKDELRSFEVKDSLKLVKAQADTAKVKPKEKSLFSKVSGGFLSGHRFYACDSNLTIRYDGLIGLDQIDFNAVDGWSYRQGAHLNYTIDSVHHWSFRPVVQYAFNREKLMYEGTFGYGFAPQRRAYFSISGGQMSKDFNEAYGIDRTLNMAYALFSKEHYMKLYQRDYIAVNQSIDLAHGLRLEASAEYNYFHELENHTNWSIAYPNKDYAPNIPPNEQVLPSHLQNQTDASVKAIVSYTPRMRYRMWKGRKIYMGSKYPTFSLGYKQGFSGLAQSDADYAMITARINQNKEWGVFNAFSWDVSGGYYLRNEQMHFSRFTHFNTNQPWLGFKEWNGTFNLLNDYSYSTNEWFGQAHVRYTTPYLLLKFLPGLSNRLWLENLYASYLVTPHLSNYTEFGYGMSQIFFMGSVGTFVGFENGQYKSWGFKVALNLNGN